jgi:hypothetical protein
MDPLYTELLKYGGVGILAFVLFYFYKEALKNIKEQHDVFTVSIDKFIKAMQDTFKEGRQEHKEDRSKKHAALVEKIDNLQTQQNYLGRKIQKTEAQLDRILKLELKDTDDYIPKKPDA